MSGPVIIRLQNLPLEARSIDIRRFFEGLLIPDGGVHIIGGERGDAFIAFQSDEDARQAMSRDGYLLCSFKIKLFLSSKTEMQNVIAAARNQQPAAKPVKDSIQSSNLSQILNIATSSTAHTGTGNNSMDLLSSLNKLISSSNNNNSITPMSLMSSNLTQKSSISKYNNYEDNKTSNLLNGLFPNNKSNEMNNDPLSSLLAKVNNPINSNSNKPVVSSNDKSNISIDQILNLLQNHIQPVATQTQQQVNAAATSSNALPSILDNKNEQKTFNYSQSNYSNNEQDESRFNNKNGSSLYNNNNNRFNNNNFNNNNNQKFQPPNNQIKRRFDENNDSAWRDSNNTDPNKAVVNKPYQRTILDPIIKVRNFNSNCSYKDIRTFLQGIQIEHDGIKLLTDPNGHRNGTAYVKLMTITDLKKALCRNGQFYEENSITVAQATENEFTNAQFVFTFRNNNNNSDKTNQFQNNQRFNNNNMNKRPDQQPQLQQLQQLQQQQIQQLQIQQQPIVNKPIESEQIQQPIPATMDTNIGFYFKIYGLPAKFDEQALRSMFNNVKFIRIVTSTPTPITSTNTTNGTTEQITTIKAKKLCQVETQLDLERALTRQDERVGKSKLQIFQISRSEYDRELANLNKNNNHYNNYQSDPLDQNSLDNNEQEDDMELSDDLFIYMHGVPFSAKEQDVRFFFQGLNIQNVNVIIDPQTQKPTGECCCQFMSKQDRDRALEKDDQLFRNRVVKVKPINQSEFNQHKFKFMSRNNKIKSIMSLSPTERGIPSLFQSNSPQDNSNDNENDEQPDEFESNNRYFDSNSNDGSEQKFNKFNNRGNFNQQRNFNDNGLKRRAINSYSTDSQSDNNNKRVKSSSFFNQRNNYSNNFNENDQNDNETDQSPILPPLPPELQKYRNRLVLFSNISFDASREDILELVKQFIPLEQTLKIRHDDMGQPTGDAVVALSTSDFAVNACLNLNGSEFMGRNIKATLFSS